MRRRRARRDETRSGRAGVGVRPRREHEVARRRLMGDEVAECRRGGLRDVGGIRARAGSEPARHLVFSFREDETMDAKMDSELDTTGTDDNELSTEGALALAPVAVAQDAEVVTREQRRSRRKRDVRARTISVKRMTKRELELGRMMYPDADVERPRTRAECANGERPCPFVSCKHHLYLDVSAKTGAIKLNFPDLEVWEMTETCALDVADRGGTTLEEVGAIMNLTRERIRQVETRGLARLREIAEDEPRSGETSTLGHDY